MMTNKWINYVLSVVVVAGLVAVAFYEQPRLAEQRAELLDQTVVERDTEERDPVDREPLDLRQVPRAEGDDDVSEDDEEAESQTVELGDHGVSASHPAAVEVGMQILDNGGNAVDAAIAVAYALGVAEPFGSGIGGGGTMLVHRLGDAPIAYDYRETAPLSGEMPASNIGVPGFAAGMEHVHGIHGSIELADLIEPAARLAEDGVEVDEYLHDRLRGAGHRLPIHLAPELFPDGAAIAAGEMLVQPAYADALRMIQEQGAEVVYDGELGDMILEAASGLEQEDLSEYEVLELEPAIGEVNGYTVISGAAPVSGPTLVQILQVSDELGIGGMDFESPDAYHAIAQAWRVALDDRTELVGDPTFEPLDLDVLLGPDHTRDLAAAIPPDGFADVEDRDPRLILETDTTHVTIVDGQGTMVSMTNTLSNFFGSGLPVSGFFLNDQLKNFSDDPDSVNRAEPGKRPRSFVTPTIIAQDDQPIVGLGSAGGRRIPMMVAQVLIHWMHNGQDLAAATSMSRFHLEGRDLELEEQLPSDVEEDLQQRGYTIVYNVPTTEYFGGIQALSVDHEAGQVTGVADERRVGTWDAASR